MDKLKEVALALGFEVSKDDYILMIESPVWLHFSFAPLILVYGPGGIMEKMGWFWTLAGDAWALGPKDGIVVISPTRDEQIVIDAYLKTLPREPELPDLPSEHELEGWGEISPKLNRAVLKLCIRYIKSLAAKVEKLEEAKNADKN